MDELFQFSMLLPFGLGILTAALINLVFMAVMDWVFAARGKHSRDPKVDINKSRKEVR